MNGDLLRSNVARAALVATFNINMQAKVDQLDTYATIAVARRIIRQLRDIEAYMSKAEAQAMSPYGRVGDITAAESVTINRLIRAELDLMDSAPEWLLRPTAPCDSKALSYADDLLTLLAHGVGNNYADLTDTANEAVNTEDTEHDEDSVAAATEALKAVVEAASFSGRGVIRYEHYVRHTIVQLLRAYMGRKSLNFDSLEGAIKKYNPILKRI